MEQKLMDELLAIGAKIFAAGADSQVKTEPAPVTEVPSEPVAEAPAVETPAEPVVVEAPVDAPVEHEPVEPAPVLEVPEAPVEAAPVETPAPEVAEPVAAPSEPVGTVSEPVQEVVSYTQAQMDLKDAEIKALKEENLFLKNRLQDVAEKIRVMDSAEAVKLAEIQALLTV